MRYVVKQSIPGYNVGDRVSDGDLSPSMLSQFCIPVADESVVASESSAPRSSKPAPASSASAPSAPAAAAVAPTE